MEWCNMRLIVTLLLIIATEAKKKSKYEQEEPKRVSLESNIPIPFGRIGIFGFGDPRTDQKQPIDFVDFERPLPKTGDSHIGRYQEMPDGNAQEPNSEEMINDDKIIIEDKPTGENDTVPYIEIDYVGALEHNIGRPPRPRQQPKPSIIRDRETIPNFADGSFLLPSESENQNNRTTCDEFVRKSYFHPKEIVNMDWVPFYVWYDRKVLYGLLHTFRYPKREEVRHFKEDIGIYLNRTVDWTAPKLLMSEYRDHMLIAADQRGLFIDVPDHTIPEYVKRTKSSVPSLLLRMKIVDKYLVVMYCDIDYAFIMSIPESIPYSDEMKAEEAAKLRLKGRGHPVSRCEKYEKDIENERAAEIRLKEPKVIYIHEPLPPIP